MSTCLVLVVVLTGCQLIINHNEFVAGDDASLSPDDGSPPGAITTGPVGTSCPDCPIAVVAGRVIWSDGVAMLDGTFPGVQSVQTNSPDDISITFSPNVFGGPIGPNGADNKPQCVCESAGEINKPHECNQIGLSTPDSVRFGTWVDQGPGFVPFNFLCTGPSQTGSNGDARWPGARSLALVGARITGTTVTQAGAWIDHVTVASNQTTVVLRTGFETAPICVATAISAPGDNHASFVRSASTTSLAISTWKGPGETVDPPGVVLLCAAEIDGAANQLVSSDPSGMVIGSVDLRDNTYGCGWSESFDLVAMGQFVQVPRTLTSPFAVAGEPFCACTPLRTNGSHLVCNYGGIATATAQPFWVFEELGGGGQDDRPTLLCVAPRSP